MPWSWDCCCLHSAGSLTRCVMWRRNIFFQYFSFPFGAMATASPHLQNMVWVLGLNTVEFKSLSTEVKCLAGKWHAAQTRMDASVTSAQYLLLSLHLLFFTSSIDSERKIVGKRPIDQRESYMLLSHFFFFFNGRIYAGEITKYSSLILQRLISGEGGCQSFNSAFPIKTMLIPIVGEIFNCLWGGG